MFQFIWGSSDQPVYYLTFWKKITLAILKIFIIENPEKYNVVIADLVLFTPSLVCHYPTHPFQQLVLWHSIWNARFFGNTTVM